MSQIPIWILTLSLTMTVALFWINSRAARQRLLRSQALDLALWMMIGAVLGGRLMHVLYEQPQYYLDEPLAFFKIWQGGFVFYGGLFGAFGLGYWWSRRYEVAPLRWADFFAPVAALTYALGRLGCFFNGCCYGRYCELPWAIHERHPTQLYATIFELGTLMVLLWLERKPKRPLGLVFFTWLVLHGTGRLIMEYFRADDRGPMPLGLSISIWISLILIGLGLFQLKKVRVSN
ncbi:MAG: prolipoprotein diacylglyceryl transferase [Bdellovibrionales bacterium]